MVRAEQPASDGPSPFVSSPGATQKPRCRDRVSRSTGDEIRSRIFSNTGPQIGQHSRAAVMIAHMAHRAKAPLFALSKEPPGHLLLQSGAVGSRVAGTA